MCRFAPLDCLLITLRRANERPVRGGVALVWSVGSLYSPDVCSLLGCQYKITDTLSCAVNRFVHN